MSRKKKSSGGLNANTLLGHFLSGLAILLPLIITVIILSWIFEILNNLIGFNSLLSKAGKSLGYLIPIHPAIIVFVSYLIIIICVTLLGYYIRGIAHKKIGKSIKNFFNKIPFVGKIYTSTEQAIEILRGQKTKKELSKFGSTVIVNFANTKRIGLLANEQRYSIDGQKYFIVFMPSSPIPATGFLYLVPEKDVRICNIRIEDFSKIVVSLGLLGKQVLPTNLDKISKLPSQLTRNERK
ncbi:MAG TPA: DUF502 domain-containing protein [Candidatus Peregrinibacteria bacterium]|nr:DUF502 domain-containing protein [Candidatus Peregrinibacteria bacterium]